MLQLPPNPVTLPILELLERVRFRAARKLGAYPILPRVCSLRLLRPQARMFLLPATKRLGSS